MTDFLGLQWDRMDLFKVYLTVEDSKTEAGEGRTIPLNSDLLEAMVDYSKWYIQAIQHHETGVVRRNHSGHCRTCLQQLNDILPINNAPLKSRSTTATIRCVRRTYPWSGCTTFTTRATVSCARRWHAVGGAGLDDSARSRVREDGLRCPPAGSRAARIAPRHRDLPFRACAQCARGGSRCRNPEQDANDNSSRNRPPFPPYYFHWMCNSSCARRWCSGCRHWPR